MKKDELKQHLKLGEKITFDNGDVMYFENGEFFYINAEDGMPQEWPFNLIFETYEDLSEKDKECL